MIITRYLTALCYYILFLFQIKGKQEVIGKDLDEADNNVDGLEKKRDDVKDIFDENRKKLPEAESEIAKAEDLAQQVNEVRKVNKNIT